MKSDYMLTSLLTNWKLAMSEVSVYEAKTQLSALLERVAAGEEVVITKRNRPVARIVSIGSQRERPKRGSARDAMIASGLSQADIDAALAPLTGDELADWGLT